MHRTLQTLALAMTLGLGAILAFSAAQAATPDTPPQDRHHRHRPHRRGSGAGLGQSRS
jgi:Spy/CpxP family protein refolding chaperone